MATLKRGVKIKKGVKLSGKRPSVPADKNPRRFAIRGKKTA